jgi:hypothetical protein
VPPVATCAVAVEAERALVCHCQRPAPGRGGGSAGTRAAQVARAVRRGVVARACNLLESAGHVEQREEGRHEHWSLRRRLGRTADGHGWKHAKQELGL